MFQTASLPVVAWRPQAPWETCIEAREASPAFLALPRRRREAAWAAHDRIAVLLGARPECEPERVTAGALQTWIWATARNPAEMVMLRHALNGLLAEARRIGLRRAPLHLGSSAHSVSRLLH